MDFIKTFISILFLSFQLFYDVERLYALVLRVSELGLCPP